ncbi:MAG: hypothetical protein U0230_21860 [Polyangiales bacterium]
MSKHVSSHRSFLPILLLSAASAALVACDDAGGGGASDGGGGGSLPTVATYEGRWLQGFCSPIGAGSSGKNLILPSLVDGSTVHLAQTVTQYAGAGCTGTGTEPLAPTDAGTIVFEATETSGSVTMNRGTWSQPSGFVSRVVWVLETPNRLCILGDQEPTVFPTPKSVADHLAILPDDVCYTRQ